MTAEFSRLRRDGRCGCCGDDECIGHVCRVSAADFAEMLDMVEMHGQDTTSVKKQVVEGADRKKNVQIY